MNKVVLVGNLTKDPELRYTGSNIPVVSFTVAINRPFTNEAGEREADYINIVAWRKQAENAGKYLTKGSKVAIEGKIQTRSYEDEEGNKHHITEVVADNIEFLSTKKRQETTVQGNQEQKKESKLSDDVFAKFGDSIEYSNEELPFNV